MQQRYRDVFGREKSSKKLWMALLGVVLVLALLAAIAVVGLWLFDLYHGYAIEGSTPSSVSGETPLQFTEADVRHTLFIETENGVMTGAALVRFDPVVTRVTVLSLPADTAVPYGTAHKKISVLYAESGARAVQEALGEALGLAVRSAAVLTAEGLSNWVERLGGGLPVEWDEPVEAGPLRLEAGRHTLTSAQVLQLLRADGGSELLARLLTALGNRYLVADRQLMTDFDRLTAAWNTASTIRRTDVIAYRTVLAAMSEANQGALFACVGMPGERVGAGDAARFELPDDVSGQLATLFG